MENEVKNVESSVPDIKEQIIKKDLLNDSSVINETNKLDIEKPEVKKENDSEGNNNHTVDSKEKEAGVTESKERNDIVSSKDINDQDSKEEKNENKEIMDRTTCVDETKDKEEVNKDVKKEASDKEASDKEASDKEASDKEASDKEASDKEASDKEASDKEASDKEASDKEASDKEASDKEASDKEDSDSDDGGNTSQTKESDETMSTLDKPASTPTCRARKKVQRLEVGFATPKEKVKIQEGSGKKLGECPMIDSKVSKHTIIDLKLVHKILYSRPGSAHEIKRNIRKFSGFCFKKDSSEFEQKKILLERYKTGDLKKVCEILDLERSGAKEDIVMRVLMFLMEPKDSGKVPKKKGSSRNKKKKTGKSPKTTKKSAKNAKEEESSDEDEEDNDKDTQSASEDDKSDEESDHEKKKLNSSKGKKTPSKTKPAKKEKVKKEPAKGTKRKKEVQVDSSDEEEEPAPKKSKSPSDNEIKKLVKQILEKADLQEITMKKVIKQVYDTYPDCDLTSKKSFIKTTIKSVIVSL